MKPVYFFLGANSEEGFFSLYDQLLGGRLDDLMILKGGPGCGKSTFMRRMGAAMERAGASCTSTARVIPIRSTLRSFWIVTPPSWTAPARMAQHH
jgi:replication-associated recombination protein RarA